MAELNENLQETFQALKQKRDEFKVKLNLGKMEARDTWEDVQDNFRELESKMKQVRARGDEEFDKMREDIEVLMGDIRDGFDRMRKQS